MNIMQGMLHSLIEEFLLFLLQLRARHFLEDLKDDGEVFTTVAFLCHLGVNLQRLLPQAHSWVGVFGCIVSQSQILKSW